ncbi:MAG: 2OG-Fe(II) oxygenase [Ascidiaceihabitans sp.]|nr:2OG-Fe(II) oxygenase [Ascidiaceihabitans sp.]
MRDIVNLDQFPLDTPHSDAYAALVARCQADLADGGMFNLDGFLRPEVAQAEVARLTPVIDTDSFLHARQHNIYFKPQIEGLASDHLALQTFETSNNTICADQLDGSPVADIYHWPAFRTFLADEMEKPALFPMKDRLAAYNVMRYKEGQALNWHFDRSEFTVTLLLQAPDAGGVFEYRTDLRTADDPNFDGVVALLNGEDPDLQQMSVVPGTLNVFRGVNTPHRVTAIKGATPRVIAVLTYFERPDVEFSDTEQLGFYGRIAR